MRLFVQESGANSFMASLKNLVSVWSLKCSMLLLMHQQAFENQVFRRLWTGNSCWNYWKPGKTINWIQKIANKNNYDFWMKIHDCVSWKISLKIVSFKIHEKKELKKKKNKPKKIAFYFYAYALEKVSLRGNFNSFLKKASALWSMHFVCVRIIETAL